MSFLNYIQDQSSKLNSRNYIKFLWNEIEGIINETEIPFTEYVNHLPILFEQFWEIALEKLEEEVETIDEIELELKIYLLTLIYHTLTQTHEQLSNNCLLYSSEIYFLLLSTNNNEDCFKRKIFRSIISTLQSSIEAASSDEVCLKLMRKLRKFLSNSKLHISDLDVVLSGLVQIIFMKTRSVIEHFDLNETPNSMAVEAFLSLKTIICDETAPSRRFIVITYLFNGLRKNNVHLTPSILSMVQLNFRNLIKDVHRIFKEDKYHTFLNAFIHVWSHPSFIYYEEAVLIVNEMRDKYYNILIDTLSKMMMSKAANKNLFRFALAIIYNPTQRCALEKVQVTNEILINNILMNCLSSKNEISTAAVETLGELLTSTAMRKDFIIETVQNILEAKTSSLFNVPKILAGLQSLATKKWNNKSKNKALFGIVIAIILYSDKDYPDKYCEVLDILTEEGSPFDLKPYINLLFELYNDLCKRQFNSTSLIILKIIFKMALHPMASSTDFVKQLYQSMIYPPVSKGVNINCDIYINPIINAEFNFDEFFQKCHTLELISLEHIAKLLGNISRMEEPNLKLLCAIIPYSQYKESSIIADFVSDNFNTLHDNPNLNYLFDIYAKIIKNDSSPTNLQLALKNNEILVCFIKYHLKRQNFKWNAVANAFSLLKSLGNVTNLSEDFMQLKQEYDAKLNNVLENRQDFIPIYYYSQLVLFGKVLPSEENMNLLTSFLDSCCDERIVRAPEFNPKIWIGCLLLYTNMSIIKSTLVETGMDYLEKGLNAPITSVKLAAINMTFDLCNMVTHSFEDLTKFMFKQLITGNVTFKRTCLLKIDRLIRDDYLKLELAQYLIFVFILGDKTQGLGDYLNQLLSENFYMSNSATIAKYFVPLIVHINGYKKHPIYTLSRRDYQLIETVAKRVSDRRRIYRFLFTGLPNKLRFNIICILANNILKKMMKNQIKYDDGFWNVIKDSIFMVKLITQSQDNESSQEYYKQIMAKIDKYLMKKTETPEKHQFQEYQKDIVQSTVILQKLLFFNDSENVQRHIRMPLFDAIMHWSDFLLADMIYLIHTERNKDIINCYTKIQTFYKKQGHELIPLEDGFESTST